MLVSAAISTCASAGDLDSNHARDLASKIRSTHTQPSDPATPAWAVERADNSSLRISALFQTRYQYSEREAGFISPGSEKTNGFSTPRTRLALDGNIVSSQFNYRISFDFGDAELSRGRGNGPTLTGDTGQPLLLDAYAQYNFAGKREGYYFKFGQFQSIIMNEEAVASEYQLGIDRGLISELLGPGYTQGLALGYVADNWAYEVSVTDGGRYIGSREPVNTAYNNVEESDLAIGFRGDWKLKGSWDQFADFTSFQGSSPAAKVGAGLLYQFQGQTNPGVFTPGFIGLAVESGQIFTWTLDYQYEGDGWNFFAAYTGQWIDWEFASTTLGTLHNGILLQGGWFLTDQYEIYSRFETFWLDKAYRNGFGTPDGFIHRIGTLGVNYYVIPESHAAKISAEVGYAFDSLFALAVGGDSIGLPDPGTTGFLGLSTHEIIFRVQLQLKF